MLWIKKIQISSFIKEHSHDMHEFLVCTKGVISIIESSKKHILRPGSTMFLPSNTAHKIENSNLHSKNSEVLLACVKPMTLDLMRSPFNNMIIDSLQKNASSTHSESNDDPLNTCVQDISELSKIPSRINQSLEENCFLKMLLLHAERLNRASALLYERLDKIDEITEWLTKNYTKDISLYDLCRMFSLSRSQLTRKFKQQYGLSLIEYVLQLRIEAAAKELVITNSDITSVALNVGFHNLSHFHRQFKKRFGMTPVTFRNMTAQTI